MSLVKVAVCSLIIFVSNVCLAVEIPSTAKDVLKLVVFQNGSQMIQTPEEDLQVSIIDVERKLD